VGILGLIMFYHRCLKKFYTKLSCVPNICVDCCATACVELLLLVIMTYVCVPVGPQSDHLFAELLGGNEEA
jgi:hypothetical protein